MIGTLERMGPGLALLLLFLPAWLARTAQEAAPTAPAWHDDLEQAFARAAASEKPLLVVFR